MNSACPLAVRAASPPHEVLGSLVTHVVSVVPNFFPLSLKVRGPHQHGGISTQGGEDMDRVQACPVLAHELAKAVLVGLPVAVKVVLVVAKLTTPLNDGPPATMKVHLAVDMNGHQLAMNGDGVHTRGRIWSLILDLSAAPSCK